MKTKATFQINGKTYRKLQGPFHQTLKPLFPPTTQEFFAKIDAIQAAQPNPMK